MSKLQIPDLQSVGLGVVDWKSTVVGNLLTFLLLDGFADHFVGDGAGTDGARYPRAHKCRPQNLLRKGANSWSNTRELIPFNHCTIGLTS